MPKKKKDVVVPDEKIKAYLAKKAKQKKEAVFIPEDISFTTGTAPYAKIPSYLKQLQTAAEKNVAKAHPKRPKVFRFVDKTEGSSRHANLLLFKPKTDTKKAVFERYEPNTLDGESKLSDYFAKLKEEYEKQSGESALLRGLALAKNSVGPGHCNSFSCYAAEQRLDKNFKKSVETMKKMEPEEILPYNEQIKKTRG